MYSAFGGLHLLNLHYLPRARSALGPHCGSPPDLIVPHEQFLGLPVSKLQVE